MQMELSIIAYIDLTVALIQLSRPLVISFAFYYPPPPSFCAAFSLGWKMPLFCFKSSQWDNKRLRGTGLQWVLQSQLKDLYLVSASWMLQIHWSHLNTQVHLECYLISKKDASGPIQRKKKKVNPRSYSLTISSLLDDLFLSFFIQWMSLVP